MANDPAIDELLSHGLGDGPFHLLLEPRGERMRVTVEDRNGYRVWIDLTRPQVSCLIDKLQDFIRGRPAFEVDTGRLKPK